MSIIHQVRLESSSSASASASAVVVAHTTKIRWPRYDKSAHHGRGDRCPISEWPVTSVPIDVLLLEGWCLGFEAKSKDPMGWMGPINHYLKKYDEVYEAMDGLIVMQIANLHWVYTWREEAEMKLRAENKPAMSREQVVDFVDRFVPVLEHYVAALVEHQGDSNIHRIPRLSLHLDEKRTPSNFHSTRANRRARSCVPTTNVGCF